VHCSRECNPSYLSTGISYLLRLAQAEVVLGQHSSICITREKKGRLKVWRVPDIESLVDAFDGVHYIVTSSSTAGVHLISQLGSI
jgi:hypothetical protein